MQRLTVVVRNAENLNSIVGHRSVVHPSDNLEYTNYKRRIVPGQYG
jgi:hypothetical protein